MMRKRWLEDLRHNFIVKSIQSDERSVAGSLLGHTMNWAYTYGIGGGQANFDEAIDNLFPRDRAMLYAYLNQKAHVDELIHAFDKFAKPLDVARGATIVDIGCGPFTAGLALANVLGNGVSFRYFGVDHAASMRTLGSELATEVRKLGEFNAATRISFHENLDAIDFGVQRSNELTVFVLSYLLASPTIDSEALVGEIARAREKIGWGVTVVLYTNSAKEGPRAQFPSFKNHMEAAGFNTLTDKTETFYDAGKDRDIHYAVFRHPGVSIVPISRFSR